MTDTLAAHYATLPVLTALDEVVAKLVALAEGGTPGVVAECGQFDDGGEMGVIWPSSPEGELPSAVALLSSAVLAQVYARQETDR